MKIPDTSVIDKIWPESELEYVTTCPYCSSTKRILAYKDVQDWSFYCAPGKWLYWECKECEALYLSPRPTEASIGKAYASYYTHGLKDQSLKQKIKTQLINEYFSYFLNINITPRLNLPKQLSFLLKPLKIILNVPFELKQLVALPKGKLMDVGCGSGNMLRIAKELGWDVTGLEIDPNAVKAARKLGVKVIEGDYRKLKQLENGYDCIICSHVLEHVHNPLLLLEMLTKSLKSKGVLFLSLPNAKSHVRMQFGDSWRGLEAPRHVAIPNLKKVIELLNFLECSITDQVNIFNCTLSESLRIKKRKQYLNKLEIIYIKIKSGIKFFPKNIQSDLIQLVIQKKK